MATLRRKLVDDGRLFEEFHPAPACPDVASSGSNPFAWLIPGTPGATPVYKSAIYGPLARRAGFSCGSGFSETSGVASDRLDPI
jgi:hypothetical protein